MPCLLSVVPKIWCHGKQFLFGFKDAGRKPGTLCSWMWIPPNFIGNLTHTHVAEMSIICYVVMLYPDFSYVVLMKNQVSMNILLCFVFSKKNGIQGLYTVQSYWFYVHLLQVELPN